eukprot:CAMPEP_0174301666 /NCGR_PEP_ID=MMETSP0809-20121228/59179_1 /TAXON_ID=73025 ORGANISM="Eutreptiella gymnastica-like, Strain CCMP1594" /NCGR_SAMPLE_ID=MMETSP0809 /ASSEMBLY_ACC=CAM_ASM_000658 /LENGTH=85 /DNA_ID=CAMNT_0015407449 /DNA_START=291 /DNA_END=551 /DNA_ORIENTATION=+
MCVCVCVCVSAHILAHDDWGGGKLAPPSGDSRDPPRAQANFPHALWLERQPLGGAEAERDAAFHHRNMSQKVLRLQTHDSPSSGV